MRTPTIKRVALQKVTLLVCVCQKCGHNWLPKVERPKKCPFCSNPNWDVGYKYKTYGGKEHSPGVSEEGVSEEGVVE